MFAQVDEAGMPLLVEGLLNVEQGSCVRNQLRSGGQKVRKESVLSIALAARRTGKATVIVGNENTRIDCQHIGGSEFLWHLNGQHAQAYQIGFALDDAQREGHE